MAQVSIADILKLPLIDRLRLVETIWDSIVEAPEAIELTDAERTELDRRWEAYKSNPSAGSPWSEVRARVLQRK